MTTDCSDKKFSTTLSLLIQKINGYSAEFTSLEGCVIMLETIDSIVSDPKTDVKIDEEKYQEIKETCEDLLKCVNNLERLQRLKYRDKVFKQSDLDDFRYTSENLGDLVGNQAQEAKKQECRNEGHQAKEDLTSAENQLDFDDTSKDETIVKDKDMDDEDDDGHFFELIRSKSYSVAVNGSPTSLRENRLIRSNRSSSRFRSNLQISGKNGTGNRALYGLPYDFKTGAHLFFTPPDNFDPNDRKTITMMVTGTEIAVADFINALINYVNGTTVNEYESFINSELFSSPITTFEINWRSGFVISSNLFIIVVTQTAKPADKVLGVKQPSRWYLTLMEYLEEYFPKGIKISAFCSVLKNSNKSSFTNAATVARKITNIQKLTIPLDKWFIFLNANESEMLTLQCGPKFEPIAIFILANAQMIKFPQDQKTRSECFANTFEELESYKLSFGNIKSGYNFSIITRRLYVLCDRLSKILRTKKSSTVAPLIRLIAKRKDAHSQDQLAAAKEIEIEITDEIWKIHTVKYKYTPITDTIAAIIIIIERSSSNFHAEVVTFLKTLFLESKKMQSLDVGSSYSETNSESHNWVGELRRRLDDLDEKTVHISTTESERSSLSGDSEHTESSVSSQ